MEELIKINQTISGCLKYKVISKTKDGLISVNGHLFADNLVNEEGYFIGGKYTLFLGVFKVHSRNYRIYLGAISESPMVSMSYDVGEVTFLSSYIIKTIRSAKDFAVYKEDCEQLEFKFHSAMYNLQTQYSILGMLRKMNNIKDEVEYYQTINNS